MSLVEFLARMPLAATAWILSKSGMWPKGSGNPADARLIWDRTQGTTATAVREAQKWFGVDATIQALGASPESIRTAKDESGRASDGSDLAAVLHNDQTNYLCGNMMVKTDRASMRNGIEVRCPFLDHHLVEHIASIPMDFKLTSRSDKVLLRESMKNDLPAQVLTRDKQGFGVQHHDDEESRRISIRLEDKLCAPDPAVGQIVNKEAARNLASASPGRARSLLVLTNWAEKHL